MGAPGASSRLGARGLEGVTPQQYLSSAQLRRALLCRRPLWVEGGQAKSARDVRYRRLADIAGCDLERRKWQGKRA